MAPKKEKVEKVSASAQEDMVLQYLIEQKYAHFHDNMRIHAPND
jgi:hypothetical protein